MKSKTSDSQLFIRISSIIHPTDLFFIRECNDGIKIRLLELREQSNNSVGKL